VRAVSLDVLESWVLPLYKRLVADDQDVVRIAAIENTVYMAQGLAQTGIDDANHQHIMPLIRSSVEDRSWRVRGGIAKQYTELSRALMGEGGQRATDLLHHDLLPTFVNLLQDPEGEVRTASCRNFASFCDLIGPTLFEKHLVVAAQVSANTVPPPTLGHGQNPHLMMMMMMTMVMMMKMMI
jgi:serine/threonine-protein phosphatase 2A regulatory subunit A